jgi:hypothetical protein
LKINVQAIGDSVTLFFKDDDFEYAGEMSVSDVQTFMFDLGREMGSAIAFQLAADGANGVR